MAETKHSIVAVKIEDTKYWCDNIRSRVKHIYGVYLYDQSVSTNCCEITPSYDLRWVGFEAEGIDGHPVSGDLLDEILEGYALSDHDNDRYVHVTAVEKIPLDGERRKLVAGWVDLEPWAEGYGGDNVIAEVIEANQGNPFF